MNIEKPRTYKYGTLCRITYTPIFTSKLVQMKLTRMTFDYKGWTKTIFKEL